MKKKKKTRNQIYLKRTEKIAGSLWKNIVEWSPYILYSSIIPVLIINYAFVGAKEQIKCPGNKNYRIPSVPNRESSFPFKIKLPKRWIINCTTIRYWNINYNIIIIRNRIHSLMKIPTARPWSVPTIFCWSVSPTKLYHSTVSVSRHN